MCVCVFSLSKQCWKACLKTSQCIQSYGLWTCRIRIRVVLVPTLMVLLQSSSSFLNLCCDPAPKNFPQLQAVDETAVENQDQMPADPQETSGRNGGVLSVTSDAGWFDMVGIWRYMLVCFQGMWNVQNPSDVDLHFLKYVCMDLGEDMVHPWFARFCKHNFDVSKMCVCVFSLSKQCWKACLKTSQCIQSYGLWTCWIRIRVVLVLTLMALLQSSLSFLNLCCDPSPKTFPPTSGCGWSGGRKSAPRCQQIHKNLWKKRWSLVCYKWCRGGWHSWSKEV